VDKKYISGISINVSTRSHFANNYELLSLNEHKVMFE